MPLLTVGCACLAFGHVALLDQVALQVDSGERVGLIGRNGSGKSSLLKALAGDTRLDDGEIWRQPGMRLAFVAQEPDFTAGVTVFAAIAAGLGEVSRLLADYHQAAHELGAGSAAESALESLHRIQAELEACDGWRLNTRVEQVLTRLGLDADVVVDTLSGGGRKRLALARALVTEPDLLLLDEPTNHLDVNGILWLEEMLLDFKGAALFVTHDRAFLDRVATRIIELDRGRLASFPGRFAEYQARKEAMLHEEALANARADKLLAQEEVWIRKGVEARRTRSVGRVKRLERLRGERVARRDQLGKVDFRLSSGDESGKLVAELEGVTKCFGTRCVVRGFSCRIKRGDKIGLIGANGSGKTTLLRLILGQIEADAGIVRQGTRLEIAYFDQFRAQLDAEATLADVISPGSDYVEIGGTRQHVIGYLGDFLFAPARARSPVKSLSGGERARLLLARLFARPANVLVLDEPTNDLDIETLELLESLLQDYPGTVFLVSHDRAFLDNVVTQCIAHEGEGGWKEYVGGYSDWLRQRPLPATSAPVKLGAGKAAPAAVDPGGKSGNAKLGFKEKRELEQLPERISALELEQGQLQARLADPECYQSGGEALRQVQMRLAEVEAAIDVAMARWEELELRAG